MTPTEKHRETAEKVVNDFRMIGDGCEGDLMEMIAAALANSEREGMKRAAEIAREQIFSASQWGRVDDELKGGNQRAEEIAAAILSEDEEGE